MEINSFEVVKVLMEKYQDYLHYPWGIQNKVYFIGVILTFLLLGFSYLVYVLPEAKVALFLFIFVSGTLTLACYTIKKELFITRTKLRLKCRNLLGNKITEHSMLQFFLLDFSICQIISWLH